MSKKSAKPLARLNILKEIIQTEEQYVTSLSALAEAYQKPLESNPKLLSKSDCQKIFSHLNSIRQVNGRLLQELKNHWDEDHSGKKPTHTLGEIFVRFAPFLKTYSIYAAQFDTICELIREQKTKNKKLFEFLTTQQKSKESLGYDINSLLIMPIQRIPRYKLLLTDLLKNTSQYHRDYPNLQKGLQEISNVANFVNEKIREHERGEKMKEIAFSIKDLKVDLITKKYWHIGDGMLKFICTSMDKIEEKKFFLFNEMIMYCTVQKDGTLVYCDHIMLNVSPFPWIKDVIDTEEIKHAFQLVAEKDTYTMFAESQEQKMWWIENCVEQLQAISAKNPAIKKTRAVLKQKPSLSKQSSRKFTLFKKPEIAVGTQVDRSHFSKRKPGIQLTEQEIKEIKEKDISECIGVCKALNTFADSATKKPDEILFNYGDIMLIYKKLSPKWWAVKKTGLNCFKKLPESYQSLKKMMQSPRSPRGDKKLNRQQSHFIVGVDDNLLKATLQPKTQAPQRRQTLISRLSIRKIKHSSTEGEESEIPKNLEDLEDVQEEYGEVGLVSAKLMRELSTEDALLAIQHVEKRNELKEQSIRNFKIKKSKGPNSLEKVRASMRDPLAEFRDIHAKKRAASVFSPRSSDSSPTSSSSPKSPINGNLSASKSSPSSLISPRSPSSPAKPSSPKVQLSQTDLANIKKLEELRDKKILSDVECQRKIASIYAKYNVVF